MSGGIMQYLSYLILMALILLALYPITLVVYGLAQGYIVVKKMLQEDENELWLLCKYLEGLSSLKEFQIKIEIPINEGKTIVTLPSGKNFYFHYYSEVLELLNEKKLE